MATTFTAYSLYTYATGGDGMAGRIRDVSGAATPITVYPNMRTGSYGDPQVEGFKLSSTALRIAVTHYDTSASQDVYIHNATNGSTLNTVTGGWSNVDNLYGLVLLGSYLYAIDYDNARVVEIDPSTYAQTGVSFTFPSSLIPSGYVAHGQSLMVVGGTLFGLFSIVTPNWTTYSGSVLVRLTVSGGTSITMGSTDYNNGFAGNAFAMDVSGSDLYVAAIGGYQNAGSYNAASRLQKIPYGASTLSTATVTDVMSPSATYPYEFRDISFNGGTAYILMGAYNSSWQLAGKLLATTDFSTFTTIDDFSAGADGYFWAAQYTADNNRIWYARGNPIWIYDAASTASPMTTLTVSSGSLYNAASPAAYTNLNDMSYVGAYGTTRSIRGYRSPLQRSNSPKAVALRGITQGRPEATEDEIKQAEAMIATV